MNCAEIYREILRKQNKKQRQAADELGISRQALWGRISYKSLTVSTADSMFRKLGYKMIVVPAGKELEAGEYEI